MMSGGPSATATFDFKGTAVDVTYTPALLRVPALWRATAGGNTSESRRLDDALSGVFDVTGSPRALVVLLLDVLDWAPRGAVALPGKVSR
jgi:hypothetical protein